jgi:flagellar basal-body rod protein FlgG
MIEAITTANTGLDASQTFLDSTGNNLANLNTTAFKSSRTLFQDLLYVTTVFPGLFAPAGAQIGRGVEVSSNDRQFTQGTLINTGQQLDVAIDGAGFFQVLRPDGTTAYTRDGTLSVDPTGRLVTADGLLLQPPITVPTNFTSISIGTNGTVQVLTPNSPNTPITVGQITLANFANPPGLVSLGGNLFAASPASGSPVVGVPGTSGFGVLRQGFLEGSNVNAASELTNLLIAQQTFVANSQTVVVANEMLLTTAELVALT